jgi:hypothetical protein
MILSGQLGPFSVVDVLQFLSLAKVTGKLVITTRGDRARLYFHDGALVYARREGPAERLGERLIRLGLITPYQFEGAKIRAEISPDKKRIGQILVDAGSLEQAALCQVVRDQILASVYEILAFESGQFQFFADILPAGEDILLDVSLDMLLLEGLRKLDELRRDDPPVSG